MRGHACASLSECGCMPHLSVLLNDNTRDPCSTHAPLQILLLRYRSSPAPGPPTLALLLMLWNRNKFICCCCCGCCCCCCSWREFALRGRRFCFLVPFFALVALRAAPPSPPPSPSSSGTPLLLLLLLLLAALLAPLPDPDCTGCEWTEPPSVFAATAVAPARVVSATLASPCAAL